MSTAGTVATPRHLWIVGAVALVWSLFGGLDYIMTQTRNEAYMGQFTAEQLDYFYGFPAWLTAFWALAVWGGVAGSALLLLRRKAAAPVLLGSFLCMVVTTIYNYAFSDGATVMGGVGVAFSALIFAVSLALVLYSRRMAARGVLV